MSKLVAFSIVEVAPPGLKTPYGVGIARDDNGKMCLVKIEDEYLNTLRSGLEGKIQAVMTKTGEFNFFVPK